MQGKDKSFIDISYLHHDKQLLIIQNEKLK